MLLFVVFLGVAWNLFQPVLESGFVSDDLVVIVTNPYVQHFNLENFRAILEPFGAPVVYAMNYSPVHLLLHAAEVRLFGDSMLGYHLVNVVLHALAAVLFALLLSSSRVPAAIAAAAGALFLVHPANVEAVAMVFEAKTVLSTALAFGALLAFWRHPLLATGLFALALLTKFSALFALPCLAVALWVRSADPEREKLPHWGWWVAWVVILTAVAIPELAAFKRAELGSGGPVPQDLLVQIRTSVGIAVRYLVMAATSFGVAAFQQPAPATSWMDPWWLAGVIALPLLGWRAGWALLRRKEEAIWWVMAAASFAPISQIFPFMYPVADRYLYTILPGLLGGTLLAFQTWAPPLERWLRKRVGRRAPDFSLARAGGLAALLGLSAVFAPRAHARTRVFLSGATIAADSARSYPDGTQSWIRRALQQARSGDVPGVVASLHVLERRRYNFYSILSEVVAPVRSDPRVKAVLDRMAQGWVERLGAIPEPTAFELMSLAQAQIQLGQRSAAIASLERALKIGSPSDAKIRTAIRTLKKQLAREQRRRLHSGREPPGSRGAERLNARLAGPG